MDEEQVLQVLTTLPDRETAERLATTLVEQRLAACVQVLGPIQSTYWWQEQVERVQEWLVLAKTLGRAWERLETTIRQEHPYEVPEILALPIVQGSRSYLDWIAQTLGG